MQTTMLGSTFVRKLSITPLTIKDSHDKNETCKNKDISFYLCFQIIQIQYLIAFHVKELSDVKLHLTFIDLDEGEL